MPDDRRNSSIGRRLGVCLMTAAILAVSLGTVSVAQSGFQALTLGKDAPWNILIGCSNSSNKPIASPQADGRLLITCFIN
jgi:hypothetical protein